MTFTLYGRLKSQIWSYSFCCRILRTYYLLNIWELGYNVVVAVQSLKIVPMFIDIESTSLPLIDGIKAIGLTTIAYKIIVERICSLYSEKVPFSWADITRRGFTLPLELLYALLTTHFHGSFCTTTGFWCLHYVDSKDWEWWASSFNMVLRLFAYHRRMAQSVIWLVPPTKNTSDDLLVTKPSIWNR